MLDRRMSEGLDRHITGNWGEDSVPDEVQEPDDENQERIDRYLAAHGRGPLAAGYRGVTCRCDLPPGLYLTDPQGHALLVGVNGRAMTLIDFGPAMADVGSVQVRSPEVLEQLADRLRFMAARLRQAGGAQ